jgi:hypothetical protein
MTPPPVPRAQPGEHQFWTDPILCKETQARVGHFRSLRWLPTNFKPKTPSIRYDLSRQAPQDLERDARFEDDIGFYNYRLWAINKVNREFPQFDLFLWRVIYVGDRLLLTQYLTTNHRDLYHPGTAEGAWPVW